MFLQFPNFHPLEVIDPIEPLTLNLTNVEDGSAEVDRLIAPAGLGDPPVAMSRMSINSAGPEDASSPDPIQTVRTFFPETWLWDLVNIE